MQRVTDWASSPALKASDAITIPAGFTFPWWYPYFKDVSDFAALTIPILSALFLLFRIYISVSSRGKY